MINVKFFTQQDKYFIGFNIFGHAGFDDKGKDIVCSAVTSCVMMTVNAIVEILKSKCKLSVDKNCIELILDNNDKNACFFIEALYLHLCLLSEQYIENISVIKVEV